MADESLPAALLGRFRPLRELGRGGCGVVYLVEDWVEAPSPKALKVVARSKVDPRSNLLRTEFGALRTLRHPGLVRVFDFGSEKGTGLVWFTSEFIGGPDLFTASASWGASELEDVLVQLGETLQFLHERQVLHNDIKPSNVRVPGGPRTARLLDFGLASSILAGPDNAGTPRYMAPERLTHGTRRTVRADLYSLGAVLYRCAVRRFPFEGEEPYQLLAAMGADIVPPRILRPDLPHYLDEVLIRLLSRLPGDRYGTASEMLDDLTRVRRRETDPASASTILPGPPLLERDAVLSDLRAACSRAREGAAPARALLIGEPGIGKSRLLEEVKQTLELDGWAVVTAAGQPGPARAWQLLREITRRLDTLPGSPVLPSVLAALDAANQGAVSEVAETFAFHVAATAAATPLAILVDDLAWGDAQSVAALLDVARGARAESRLAIVAATRESAEPAEATTRWKTSDLPIFRLAPLSSGAQRELLTSLFPGAEIPERIAADAAALAAGNPLALEEIARTWVQAGAVKKVGGARRFVPELADTAIRGGGKPRDLIAARLAGLDRNALRLVRLVALHGRPVAAAILSAVEPETESRLPDLQKARFLARSPGGIDVQHPLVREAALAATSDLEARGLNLALGEALDKAGAGSEEVWGHLLRGGDIRRGLRHALAAAARAEAVEDYRSGRSILEEARRVADSVPDGLTPDEWRRLRESLAVCLDEIGDREEAVPLLERALEAAAGTAEAARLRMKLGRVLFRAGRLARAERSLRDAASAATDPLIAVEAAAWRANVLVALGRAAEAREACAAQLAVADALEPDPRAAGKLAFFYGIAAMAELSSMGIGQAVTLGDRAVAVADRSGLATVRAAARLQRAWLLTERGDIGRALVDLEEAGGLLALGGSVVRRIDLLRFLGEALHYAGQSARALEVLTSPLFESATAVQKLLARPIYCEALAGAGDPSAVAIALEIARSAAENEHVPAVAEGMAAALEAILWLGDNEALALVEPALTRVELTSAVPHDRSLLLGARAMRMLAAGDPSAAVPTLEEALASAVGFCPFYLPRWRFHLAYALALCDRRDEAVAAAIETEAGYRRLGNEPGRARAQALADAIVSGRLRRSTSPAEWLARVERATDRAALVGDPARALVEAVARAADAPAVWLLAGSPTEPDVISRAGPCAIAEGVAWRAPVERALAARERVYRPGIGLAMPVELAGETCALVVEDRTWPRAFSPDAAAAAQLAASRAAETLESRRLTADLGAARHALEDARTRPSPAGNGRSTLTTAASRARGSRLTGSRPLELTVGSLVLRHAFEHIIGRSKPMRRALQVIDRAVALDANLLVIGETGTGKELVARALHEQGPRAAGPFVAVNCAAVPRTLAESELFGHVPGAFTGAGRARHQGYFEQASGGTLLLDEVAELELPMQAKLLRALEEREIRPVGSDKTIPVDIRVVAATNRDLAEEVKEGRFRADLLYRLAVIEVRLPPLRERADDIPLLVKHLLRQMADPPPPTVSPDALDALCAYPWPGNVRELHNQLERAAAFCTDGVIRVEHLAASIRSSAPIGGGTAGKPRTLRQAVDALERRLLADALRASAGKKAPAARALGLTPLGLTLKMKRLGLAPALPKLSARR